MYGKVKVNRLANLVEGIFGSPVAFDDGTADE